MDKNKSNDANTHSVIRPEKGSNSDTFGLVIGNLDPQLREALGLPEDCASIGIVSSKRRNAGPIFGADEAIK